MVHHENIPKFNETLIIGHFEFRILKVGRTKIELVQVKILEK